MMDSGLRQGRFVHVLLAGAALLLVALAAAYPSPVAPAGTRGLYPAGAPGFRPSIEWRTSTYGNRQLYRRTLLKVFAEQGEYILSASSAVGVASELGIGDILIFDPGQVQGPIGREVIPDIAAFSCLDQRAAPGDEDRGRIGSREAELAGVNLGYRPCVYQAPTTGVYDVAILGPDGRDSDREITPSGLVEALPADFGPDQATGVTAWELMVADDPAATPAAEERGRVFAYYMALLTGGNGRPVDSTVYVVTVDGFVYTIRTRGLDPYGFVFYSNRVGFLNTDGNPLYRNVMARADLPEQDQNQLVALQGGVTVALPEHPLFLQPPAEATLRFLGIPLEPRTPVIANLRFIGPDGEAETGVGQGGTFSFDLVAGYGIFYLVISRDGQNFDPSLPENRVLYGRASAVGPQTISWDGNDNVGRPFPEGNQYRAAMALQGGEVHFPALDIENNLVGSVVTLTNPPGGVCPPLNGGCAANFYDDRGYLTADGVLVGTELNGPLCPGNVGNPPAIPNSDPFLGFDSNTDQRGWGFAAGGNPPQICDPAGGFGDKKGLDRWAFYPSNRLDAPLVIASEPTAVTLMEFTAQHTGQGVLVRWTTGVEIGTLGFHLYRAASGERADAVRITPSLIRSQGSPTTGASYSWRDNDAVPGVAYSYWLVEVEAGGQAVEYPPAQALRLAAGPGEQVFLPLVFSLRDIT